METLLTPESLAALKDVGISVLLIVVLFYLIRNQSAADQRADNQLTDQMKMSARLITALESFQKGISSLERSGAQTVGAIEAQGVINAKVVDNLTILEVSFRNHNKAVTDTLSMLSLDVTDLHKFFEQRTDVMIAKIDALPADVGLVVKEHIAAMLLQSTPPPKITGEQAKVILESAKKPPLVNGAAVVTDEMDKGLG